ncbi:N-acetyldiaminopimelate deacetylase [Alkalicoccus urumqiensis]|uniref:N-acetyldiaminopimelate deacetylase n=1 Tax=Alkalicoccus urumqiensis TaxID=1548213 RepID=A0A2P6MEW1_ALKUR|nr:N-acetyldiaminopimelate deacetylase [Alkalicoccus urumqiensis]PRO64781.1 N-acetyldiaminopimelate deacetylase [Alkalicoccus urumqiensis]
MTEYIWDEERLAARRRALHQIPEAGFQEFKTQKYLLDIFYEVDAPHVHIHTWKTGIFVFIEGTKPDRTIAWRADMDGLPITEETGYSFSSQHEGMMHACGHDFHMTIGSSLVEYFADQRPVNNMLFLFQPAEEGPGGALPMMQSELFQKYRPDEIYALHIAPDYPVGTCAANPGILFANTSELFIDFHGRGGHAAFPHTAEDMTVAAAHFITQLQTIVSRNVSPLDSAVVTIGKMESGTKQNIIAEKARVEGTIRTLSVEAMQEVKERIEGMLRGIEASFRCSTSVDYGSSYCQVYNDETLFESFKSAAVESNVIAFEESSKAMTGEDFGYFLEEIPGLMFWLGVDSASGLHSSTLKPEEQALAPGVEWLVEWLSSRDASVEQNN